MTVLPPNPFCNYTRRFVVFFFNYMLQSCRFEILKMTRKLTNDDYRGGQDRVLWISALQLHLNCKLCQISICITVCVARGTTKINLIGRNRLKEKEKTGTYTQSFSVLYISYFMLLLILNGSVLVYKSRYMT